MEKLTHRNTVQETPQIAAPITEQNSDQSEIDLLELFYRLVENVRYIIIAAVIGGLLAWLYTTMFIDPLYTATAKLYVLNTGSTSINVQDLQLSNYLASDYQEVFKNWHVHDMVIERLNLPYTYKQMSNMLSVSNPTNTRILYISVTTKDPAQSKLIADTYASVAQEFIATTMDTREPNVFEEALLPSAPSSPNKSRNLVIGILLGVIIACGIIVLRYLTDDKIHSSEDVEKYIGLPCLGMLPLQDIKNNSKAKQKKKGGVWA